MKETQSQQPVLIEKTAKRFKAAMAGAVAGIFLGFGLILSGLITAGGLLIILGVALLIAARAAAWWHHG